MISSEAFKESSLGVQIKGPANMHSGSGTEEQEAEWQQQEGGEQQQCWAGRARGRGLWEVASLLCSLHLWSGGLISPDPCILPAATDGPLIDLLLPRVLRVS